MCVVDGGIDISAESGEHGVVVSVADRGPGIPAGEEERVFEKFHHAVLDAVAGAPAARKALFHWAMKVAWAVAGARSP